MSFPVIKVLRVGLKPSNDFVQPFQLRRKMSCLLQEQQRRASLMCFMAVRLLQHTFYTRPASVLPVGLGYILVHEDIP